MPQHIPISISQSIHITSLSIQSIYPSINTAYAQANAHAPCTNTYPLEHKTKSQKNGVNFANDPNISFMYLCVIREGSRVRSTSHVHTRVYNHTNVESVVLMLWWYYFYTAVFSVCQFYAFTSQICLCTFLMLPKKKRYQSMSMDMQHLTPQRPKIASNACMRSRWSWRTMAT